MEKKLYDLMDWAAIEAVVYGETDAPQELLGAHNEGKQTLVQAFFPGARKAVLYIDGEEGTRGKTVKSEVRMEKMDEAGYFAALLPGKNRKDYSYHVEYETDKLTKSGRKSVKSVNYKECYCYQNLIPEKDSVKFSAGTLERAYEILGSHLMTMDGVRGCRFTVWAPNAVRVSVCGDFNGWNPLMHQMMRRKDGIFELFVPGAEEGDHYKYQILAKGMEPYYKADPYSFRIEKEEGRASMITSLQGFRWEDDAFLKERSRQKAERIPYNAYELPLENLSGTDKPEDLIQAILTHVKNGHYTHVELMPVMDTRDKDSAGYAVTQFYALCPRFGSLKDYRKLINELHKNKIGVILQWPMQSFEASAEGLSRFDGSGLYEHEDERQGVDPRNGRHMFQYGRPQVYSFLLSNAVFFARELHADGLKFCDLASILYLDYYRNPGEWVPNIYGGNENLDSVDFVKSVNEVLHKEFPGFLTIAEDESCWPNLTSRNSGNDHTQFESLGFDYAIDFGYNRELLEYMQTDPIERKNVHDKLTTCSLYQYNEEFILPVMHQNTGFRMGGLLQQMPGDFRDRINNLKIFYGYTMLRIGKKQMFMGQEYGLPESFAADTVYEMPQVLEEGHSQLFAYCADLNAFYLDNAWLYEDENEPESFQWINQMSANENVISFLRRGKKEGEELTVILNFANTEYYRYRIGCDRQGKYKEIFSSDEEKYDGLGRNNQHVILTKDEAYDGREYSFVLNLPPLSMTILTFTPYTQEEKEDILRRRKIREEKRLAMEEERRKLIAEKVKKQQLLAAEKEKIRRELKEELDRRYKEAEERIYGKSKKSRSGK